MEEKTRRRRPKETTEGEDAEKPTRENDRRADRRRRRGEKEGYQGEKEKEEKKQKRKTGAENRYRRPVQKTGKRRQNPLQVRPQKLHDLCAHRVIQQRERVELARHLDESAFDAGGFECRDQGIRLSYRGELVGRVPDEEWRI